MTSDKTSKPESSAMNVSGNQRFDKLYWLRIGLALLGGFGANAIFRTDYIDGLTVGIICYLASYYLARFFWFKGLDREHLGKVYSTGIGGFVLFFLFAWILSFTLSSL